MPTIYENFSAEELPALLKRPVFDSSKLDAAVSTVLKEIEEQGDDAVRRYTSKFDGVDIDAIQVTDAEIAAAEDLVSDNLKKAIQMAKENIATFHTTQKEEVKVVETRPGVRCWRKSLPIERVGLYIPGGTAPLFSTVLMLGVPAKLVGCKEVILCSPPNKEGRLHPAILYAAKTVGIDKVFRVGGVQAIGGMAYGTATIPKVYKIFGPGNQYVMAAKSLVQRVGVSIDMPAGPSEVMVVADETCNPVFAASDLLSQAEHGPDSQVILVTTVRSVADAVNAEVEKQVKELPRCKIAETSLGNSKCIVVKDRDQAVEVTNMYAAEHLILQVSDVEKFAEKIVNAGSVFMGNYSPESVGDYISGTNHTLPTNGYARMYSGVSYDSFVKKVTFQQLSGGGLKVVGPSVEVMAEAEELVAHKRAVTLRLASLQ
jgi:histidinol dehydrogenase